MVGANDEGLTGFSQKKAPQQALTLPRAGSTFGTGMARKLRVQYPGAVCLSPWAGPSRTSGAGRKGDPHKVRIAARLRRETTMTLGWLANRLCMGAPT